MDRTAFLADRRPVLHVSVVDVIDNMGELRETGLFSLLYRFRILRVPNLRCTKGTLRGSPLIEAVRADRADLPALTSTFPSREVIR